MKNRKAVFAILALALLAAPFLIGATLHELPAISIAPEVLFRIGDAEHGFPFTNSLLLTIIVDIVLIVTALLATSRLRSGGGLVPTGLQNFMELAVEGIYNLARGVDRKNVNRFFPIVATIFFFVLLSNWIALTPLTGAIGVCKTHHAALVNHTVEGEAAPAAEGEGAEEAHASAGCDEMPAGQEQLVLVPLLRSPSADINVTLALALVSFFVTEYFGFKEFGFGYLGKFLPYKDGPIMIFVGILEFLSEFVRIIAFTFRLFGNIFAGEVVLLVMTFLVPWVLPIPFYGLEVFVGFIQAFVFMILTVTFISMALTPHHPHHEEH